ncbi:hypothetical protein GCM10008098_25680 [Rhodanobacter panaciterrae]|uniref:Transposase n=1 Tax=Rhodanobacter panaciterrae TaxID=490572 RepID=A0ABQ3A0C3_9GAMM|nr:hypothetical protein [Rhodanobacter panaciterrae]GGY30888.1 hypothetical protein GCM10008098_25680 [Rhodanobacter panaciterrae]
MNPLLRHILMAYRPLYQRGLLMDGQYRWPAVDVSNDRQEAAAAAPAATQPRRRLLLAALTGLYHRGIFHHRSKS